MVSKKVSKKIQVGVVMGSQSDWKTMEHTVLLLEALGIVSEKKIVSAHRTPDRLFDYAESAREHLPGMLAAKTSLPVLGVPVASRALKGLDSLLSIAQMPAGIPVATFAIGEAGAKNAALFAAAILANEDEALALRLEKFRSDQTKKVAKSPV